MGKCLKILVSVILVCSGLSFLFSADDQPKYHNYVELTAALKSIAGKHPSLARLQSIGKTSGGREIWLVELGSRSGQPLESRPGLLVAANFEADHLIGSEIVLSMSRFLLENYAANAEIKKALDESVVYLIPRVNPDGAEEFFAPVKFDRKTNLRPRDDDNDGRVDEDGPEDLNKDGIITLMRVKSPDGEYIIDPEEPRLMRKADPKKGERGMYKIFWEGIDNDGDGFINEDPPGGTDIGRNFTHEYPYYKPDAGPHMVSENESRALMDWIIKNRNVAAILTFSESDNLISPVTSSSRFGQSREIDLINFANASVAGARTTGMIQTPIVGTGRRGIPGGEEFSFEMLREFEQFMVRGQQPQAQETTGRIRMPERQPATNVNAADVEFFRQAGEKYAEITGIKQALYVRQPQGAFFQYGYFQFGVPSFSTPGFGLATVEAAIPRRTGMPQATDSGGQRTGTQATAQASRPEISSQNMQQIMQMMQSSGAGAQVMRMFQGQAGSPQTEAGASQPGIDKQILKWFESEKIDGFLNWTKFQHPALGEVEIGGFKPYAVTNPPAAKIPELGQSHSRYAVYLASLFPKVKIASTKVVNQGGGIFSISAEVENNGFWPTALAHGVTARAVRPVMVQLDIKTEDIIAGSNKTNFVQTLAGNGGRASFNWIVKGKSGQEVQVRVFYEKNGVQTASVILK